MPRFPNAECMHPARPGLRLGRVSQSSEIADAQRNKVVREALENTARMPVVIPLTYFMSVRRCRGIALSVALDITLGFNC